jgi:hypothetical protein
LLRPAGPLMAVFLGRAADRPADRIASSLAELADPVG